MLASLTAVLLASAALVVLAEEYGHEVPLRETSLEAITVVVAAWTADDDLLSTGIDGPLTLSLLQAAAASTGSRGRFFDRQQEPSVGGSFGSSFSGNLAFAQAQSAAADVLIAASEGPTSSESSSSSSSITTNDARLEDDSSLAAFDIGADADLSASEEVQGFFPRLEAFGPRTHQIGHRFSDVTSLATMQAASEALAAAASGRSEAAEGAEAAQSQVAGQAREMYESAVAAEKAWLKAKAADEHAAAEAEMKAHEAREAQISLLRVLNMAPEPGGIPPPGQEAAAPRGGSGRRDTLAAVPPPSPPLSPSAAMMPSSPFESSGAPQPQGNFPATSLPVADQPGESSMPSTQNDTLQGFGSPSSTQPSPPPPPPPGSNEVAAADPFSRCGHAGQVPCHTFNKVLTFNYTTSVFRGLLDWSGLLCLCSGFVAWRFLHHGFAGFFGLVTGILLLVLGLNVAGLVSPSSSSAK
eukprot:CAMPEP_0206442718 /NCGR_PEP_ID=MMETSP0324_2-20121206/13975_1 /ASSEMBLY_ACC=CAM_ASM_000836 /TAXON_ID=2866 /ORGANISM="Crypthecodinium cohnii, Strain Seligo" /LENGTH=468 /DNA_ID=CAMNT_0053910587 /DNA_START=59 /DNA_END=1465 /DNA_ORIENTATION=+